MSMIKGENTKPEIIVRKFLHANGYRYRINDKRYPGKPDIILPKYRVAILINGCFWHGHEGCKFFKIPETRTEWWKEKIYQTKKRDELKKKELEDINFNVITIWECELKAKRKFETFNYLLKRINESNKNKY